MAMGLQFGLVNPVVKANSANIVTHVCVACFCCTDEFPAITLFWIVFIIPRSRLSYVLH